MPTIFVKDYNTEVDFPDNMNPEDIQAVLQKHFPAKEIINQGLEAGAVSDVTGPEPKYNPQVERPVIWETPKPSRLVKRPSYSDVISKNETLGDVSAQVAKDVAGLGMKMAGGFVKEATLGAINPIEGTLGIPFTSLKTKYAPPIDEALQFLGINTTQPYIDMDIATGGAEMAGVLAPWTMATKAIDIGVTATRMALNPAREISKAVSPTKIWSFGGMMRRAAEQAATGAIIGAAEVRNKPEISELLKNSVTTAALGAAMQVGTEGVIALLNRTPITRYGAYQQLKKDISDIFFEHRNDPTVTKEQANIAADVFIKNQAAAEGVDLGNMTAKDIRSATRKVRTAKQAKPPAEPPPETATGPQQPPPETQAGAPPPSPAGETPPPRPAPGAPAPPVMPRAQKLSPEFFRDVKAALTEGKDRDGQPFTMDDARGILEAYKGQPGADPISIRTFEMVLGPEAAKPAPEVPPAPIATQEPALQVAPVIPQGPTPAESLTGFRTFLDSGPEMAAITLQKQGILAVHPQLADDLNKAIIEYQGSKPLVAPTEPIQEIAPKPAVIVPSAGEPEIVEPGAKLEGKVGKEPWEMTSNEYTDSRIASLAPEQQAKWKEPGREIGKNNVLRQWGTEHYEVVKKALSEGKPVPPEVLKDYPDLKAKEAGVVVKVPQFSPVGYTSEAEAGAAIQNRKLKISDYDINKIGERWMVTPRTTPFGPKQRNRKPLVVPPPKVQTPEQIAKKKALMAIPANQAADFIIKNGFLNSKSVADTFGKDAVVQLNRRYFNRAPHGRIGSIVRPSGTLGLDTVAQEFPILFGTPKINADNHLLDVLLGRDIIKKESLEGKTEAELGAAEYDHYTKKYGIEGEPTGDIANAVAGENQERIKGISLDEIAGEAGLTDEEIRIATADAGEFFDNIAKKAEQKPTPKPEETIEIPGISAAETFTLAPPKGEIFQGDISKKNMTPTAGMFEELPKAESKTAPPVATFADHILQATESTPSGMLSQYETALSEDPNKNATVPKGMRIALENMLFAEIQKNTGELGGAVTQIGLGNVGEGVFEIDRPYGKLIYNEATGEISAVPAPTASNMAAERAKFGVDKTLLLQTLSKDIVNNDLPGTIANETIQNSLDAFLPSQGAKNIEISIESDYADGGMIRETVVVVTDNGRGMSAGEVKQNLLKLGAKGKSGTSTRGGYGLAKAGFLLAPRKAEITTVKDGISTTLKGTREQFFGVKGASDPMIETIEAPGSPNGTKFELHFFADQEIAEKENAYALEQYNATCGFDRYLNEGIFVDGVTVDYKAGYNARRTIEYHHPSKLPQVYPKQNFKLKGSDLSVYFVEDKNPNRKGWDGKFHPKLSTLNKGLALFGITKDQYRIDGLHVQPAWKVIVDFNKTPDVRDINYPFIRNRTQMNKEISKEVATIINTRIKSLNEADFDLQKTDFEEMVAKSPVINGIKILIPFKDQAEFDKATKLVTDNSELVNDLAGVFKSFQAALGKIGGKSIELAMTVDPKVHGYRSDPSVVGHEFYAINPFAVTHALVLNSVYRQITGAGYDPTSAMASNLVHVLVHEYTHNQAKGEGENFTSVLAQNYMQLTHGVLARLEQQARRFYGSHGSKLESIQDDLAGMGKGGSRFSTDSLDVYPPRKQPGGTEDRRGVQNVGTEPGPERVETPPAQYSITPAQVGVTLADVKDIFKGQEVIQPGGPESPIYIKTRAGKYLTIEMVNQITPDEVEFEYAHREKFDPKTMTISGAYSDGVVRLVRGIAGKWTLAHETGGHLFEDAGILNSSDIAILRGHIKGLVRDGKRETANKNDIGGSEDRANFIADELTAEKPKKGLVSRVIARIREFIDRLINAFGKRTAGGITRDIESGRIFEREGKEQVQEREAYAAETTPKAVGQIIEGGLPEGSVLKVRIPNPGHAGGGVEGFLSKDGRVLVDGEWYNPSDIAYWGPPNYPHKRVLFKQPHEKIIEIFEQEEGKSEKIRELSEAFKNVDKKFAYDGSSENPRYRNIPEHLRLWVRNLESDQLGPGLRNPTEKQIYDYLLQKDLNNYYKFEFGGGAYVHLTTEPRQLSPNEMKALEAWERAGGSLGRTSLVSLNRGNESREWGYESPEGPAKKINLVPSPARPPEGGGVQYAVEKILFNNEGLKKVFNDNTFMRTRAKKLWDHSIIQELKDFYKKPSEISDVQTIIGKYTGALQIIDHDLGKVLKDINSKIPKDRQEAITRYMQAGGDESLLQERADQSSTYKKSYENALTLTAEEKQYANIFRQRLDIVWQEANEAGVIDDYIENYVRGEWDRPNDAGRKLNSMVAAGTFRTNPKEAMHKVFQNYFEGEQAGYKPTNSSIGYQLVVAERSLRNAVEARKAIKSFMGSTEADGRPTVSVGGAGIPLSRERTGEIRLGQFQNPEREAYFIKPNVRGKDTGDYQFLDHPAMRKWKWVDKDETGKPIFLEGNMWVHPKAFGRINALLGRSKIREYTIPEDIPIIGGTHPGDAALRAGAFVKGTILLGPFHQFHVAEHAIFHKVNPFNLPEIDFKTRPILMEGVEHGLQLVNHNALQEFGEGLATGGLFHKIPIVGDYLKQYQEWLFQGYIPKLKAAMYEHAVERAEKYYAEDLKSGKFTRNQLLDNAARQANAAFGELNYKYMGRNRTLQDALRIVALAPDFLEARLRFAGQALRPKGKEQSMALIRGAVIMASIAQILNLLIGDDHEFHWDRPFSIIVGGREYTPRSVVGDMMHLITDARNFMYKRMNPLWGKPLIEIASGKDAFGRHVDADDMVKDILKSWTPIPAQGLVKDSHDTLLKSIVNTIFQSVGLSNYEYRSNFDKAVMEKFQERMIISAPKAERDRLKLIHKYSDELTRIIKNKESSSELMAEIRADIRKGNLYREDMQTIRKRAATTRTESLVKGLSAEDLSDIWSKATEEEKKKYGRLKRIKMRNLQEDHPERYRKLKREGEETFMR